MRIALTERVLVDIEGPDYRAKSDLKQLGLSTLITEPPEGFKDWGVVTWNGTEFYMASYTPPEEEDAPALT